MLDLFYQGGLFMGVLTLLLFAILAMTAYKALQISNHTVEHSATFRYQLKYIKSMGLFALVFGILSQLAGMYQMFSAIERAGDIAPGLLAGGLKISMIPMIYGVIIFLVSYIVWLALDYKFKERGITDTA